MPTDILMPKLSDTMEEGKVLKWLKHPGERVRTGDVLAEVETDKANMEIEAFDEGVLAELKVQEGESAPVGAVIAVLSDSATASPAAAPVRPDRRPEEQAPPPKVVSVVKPKTEPARPKEPPKAAPPRPGEHDDRVRASPLARRIAADRGIDLRRLTGSGPGGRIVERDLESDGGRAAPPPSEPAAPSRAAAPAPRRTEAPPSRRVELSRIRRTTAKRMAEAKQTVPHFYVSGELAMDEAIRLREALAARGEAFQGVTVTHLLLKACGLALARVAEMNASYDEGGVLLHEAVNIGLATATDDGLIVPVVHGCDRAPLADLVRAARAVVERARTGKLGGDDLSGATFSLSNLGMFPVSHFAAVVNPPQAAILAVGTIRAVPVVRDGAVVPGHRMTVTLSCDHRAVDGALAGRFLGELRQLVEQPLALVL